MMTMTAKPITLGIAPKENGEGTGERGDERLGKVCHGCHWS
jgi:hypothetical protein